MPVFICEACNETLKQTKVATHNCPGCWYFSCLDCNKKFGWDEYATHTKCVSEAERYQGHLYQAKENKGEKKQADWLGAVHAKLQAGGGDKRLNGYIERLLQYDNVPRKKAKFVNFAKNSLNLKADREGIAEKLWDLVAPDTAGAAQGTPAAPTPPAPSSASATTPAAAQADRRGSQLPSMPNSTNVGSLMSGAPAKKTEARAPAESDDDEDEQKTAKAKAKAEAKAAKKAAKAEKEDAKPGGKSDDGDKKSKKRTLEGRTDGVSASTNEPKLGHGGKRLKGQPQPPIDTATKPIKWKKIIQKELKSEGGSMTLKNLKKACVAEARAHPSHTGRDKEQIKQEFDEVLPTFHKFKVHNNVVSFAEGGDKDDD